MAKVFIELERQEFQVLSKRIPMMAVAVQDRQGA